MEMTHSGWPKRDTPQRIIPIGPQHIPGRLTRQECLPSPSRNSLHGRKHCFVPTQAAAPKPSHAVRVRNSCLPSSPRDSEGEVRATVARHPPYNGTSTHRAKLRHPPYSMCSGVKETSVQHTVASKHFMSKSQTHTHTASSKSGFVNCSACHERKMLSLCKEKLHVVFTMSTVHSCQKRLFLTT